MGNRENSREETTVDKAPSYELAYSEAVRGLSEQQSTLDNSRTRAGTLVAAAAITTSFLGGQALKGASPSIWTWLAILCFLGLGVVVVVILLPREAPRLPEDAHVDKELEEPEELESKSLPEDAPTDDGPEESEEREENEGRRWGRWASPSDLIETYIEVDGPPSRPQGPRPVHLIHRDLALHMEMTYDGNLVELDRLNRYFRLAAGLLALEILAWVVDLASGP